MVIRVEEELSREVEDVVADTMAEFCTTLVILGALMLTVAARTVEVPDTPRFCLLRFVSHVDKFKVV